MTTPSLAEVLVTGLLLWRKGEKQAEPRQCVHFAHIACSKLDSLSEGAATLSNFDVNARRFGAASRYRDDGWTQRAISKHIADLHHLNDAA